MTETNVIAPLIAVVGCDGSGKSRLSHDILAHVQRSHPAEAGYLGLGSGEQGRRIGRWPLIGPMLQRKLEEIADRLRDPAAPIPGMIAARYALRKSKKRHRRFAELLEKRRRGVVIVTDRYPQLEVPGLHDGPILAGLATSPALARLQAEERALYTEMAAYVPTLVIRLNIDVETAMARKPDHDRALIARKVDSLPKVLFNKARTVNLDATKNYDDELAQAIAAVDAALAS